ncbi:MAG: amidohydrolase family protein [Deltaproteobacteria bacterium]|nr:amidohydrolase family protein [Deltaproteobacteria bacterium]
MTGARTGALAALAAAALAAGCGCEDAAAPVPAGGAGAGGVGGGASSTPSPPPEVIHAGKQGLLLRGVVLAPQGVLDPGEVLVVGQTIRCVAADCTKAEGAASATWIDTHGVVSPGLIDSHNHVAYDFLPEWVPDPPRTFENRYQWTEDPQYEEHIRPYAAHKSENAYFCPGAKWGELRALGSCIDWGIRNADRYHGMGYDHMQQTIGSVRDIADAEAAKLIAGFDAPAEPFTRFAVHMAEGFAGDHVDEEFDSFAGRDPRPGYHQDLSLLYKGTAVLIHSIPLSEGQLQEALATESKIVWSPSSNFALYGAGVTAPIRRILQLGIVTGLGPDWTVSGQDEMLSEMRFALGYARDAGIGQVTPERLWRMATADGAVVVGLQEYMGRLEPGERADVAVFGRTGPDPYLALVESRAADVRLVLLDGQGYFGDAGLPSLTRRNEHCEDFDACGTAKFICVQDSPDAEGRRNETLADIHQQLYDILEGVAGAPPEEQYGRGDELLELVDCGI